MEEAPGKKNVKWWKGALVDGEVTDDKKFLPGKY
jgi:hypothetical protein